MRVSKWVTMSSKSGSVSGGQVETPDVMVSFGDRFAASDQFTATFKEGMALVERTAAYLDGEGRKAAKGLKPPVSVIYATESMRLTTRLLELASWLLIRRALNEGEIGPEEAAQKQGRVKLRTQGRPSHITHFEDLPAGLKGLIEESFRLTDRIVQLELALNHAAQPAKLAAPNPVATQMARLKSALGDNVIGFNRKS
jgi:regulator of CtrA degradation